MLQQSMLHAYFNKRVTNNERIKETCELNAYMYICTYVHVFTYVCMNKYLLVYVKYWKYPKGKNCHPSPLYLPPACCSSSQLHVGTCVRSADTSSVNGIKHAALVLYLLFVVIVVCRTLLQFVVFICQKVLLGKSKCCCIVYVFVLTRCCCCCCNW